jgi:MerR family transcriptional regulator, heat shock protein HspR
MDASIDRFEPVFTIGTVAQKLGIAVQTVRMYENDGLILPHKTETGRRMYSLHDLERLRCIREMIVAHGLNISGIQRLFSLIPCWDYMGGVDDDCLGCPVYSQAVGPCWHIREVGEKCKKASCRDCEVYRLDVNCHTIKRIIYKRNEKTKDNSLSGVQ